MDSNIRKMKKGEVIFKEGEIQMWMYALLKGSVGIYANYGTDAEKLAVSVYNPYNSAVFKAWSSSTG